MLVELPLPVLVVLPLPVLAALLLPVLPPSVLTPCSAAASASSFFSLHSLSNDRLIASQSCPPLHFHEPQFTLQVTSDCPLVAFAIASAAFSASFLSQALSNSSSFWAQSPAPLQLHFPQTRSTLQVAFVPLPCDGVEAGVGAGVVGAGVGAGVVGAGVGNGVVGTGCVGAGCVVAGVGAGVMGISVDVGTGAVVDCVPARITPLDVQGLHFLSSHEK